MENAKAEHVTAKRCRLLYKPDLYTLLNLVFFTIIYVVVEKKSKD